MPSPLTEPRISPRKVSLLSKGTAYDFRAVSHIERDYSVDVVEHLVRYWWGTILSNYTKSETLMVIYCDITQAVQALPPAERKAIKLVMLGYEVRDTKNGVAAAMGMPGEYVRPLIRQAYRHISDFLLRRQLPEG